MRTKTIVSFISVILLSTFFGFIANCQDKSNNKNQLIAAFTASSYQITAGESVDFFDATHGDIPTYWFWSFPGSETPHSYDQNPTEIFYLVPGEYEVVLEVQNATSVDQEYIGACIIVLENTETPIANFIANNLIISQGQQVTFTDLSQNSPIKWNWEFEGGIPSTSEQQNPNPIGYMNPGTYDVRLTIEDAGGQQSVRYKEDYITVIEDSYIFPVADFLADRIYINTEELISFTDLTEGSPYRWEWLFEKGTVTETSILQHPKNILYQEEGIFDVTLIVHNNLGTDTIVKEGYITVSDTDTCSEPPLADFYASPRLIKAGTKVYFEDRSTNNPTYWNWYFENGQPDYSPMTNTIYGIEYNFPGTYKASLSVGNLCGTSLLVKHEYIYVFSGSVPKYCDTVSNTSPGENLIEMPLSGSWGHVGGHNGQRIRTYADKFETHSYTQIEGMIIPVYKSEYASESSYVTFYVWDGNESLPSEDNILYEKKILLKDINPSFYNLISFESPVEVEGPFFLGYRINYIDNDGDGISDDRFAISVAENRNYFGARNTLYVEHNSIWYSAPAKFNVYTSSGIRPISCIVDISEFELKNNIDIFPNPASSNIFINTGELNYNQEFIVQIIDITGKIVFTTTEVSSANDINIDISNLKSGLYFVNLLFDNQKITKKIIVQQ